MKNTNIDLFICPLPSVVSVCSFVGLYYEKPYESAGIDFPANSLAIFAVSTVYIQSQCCVEEFKLSLVS